MCVSSHSEHVIETRITTAAQFLLYMLDRQPSDRIMDRRLLIREAISLTDLLIDECAQTVAMPDDIPPPSSPNASLDVAIERAAIKSAAAQFGERLDHHRERLYGPHWYRRPGSGSTCGPDKTTLN
jgi:hypothetical protein